MQLKDDAVSRTTEDWCQKTIRLLPDEVAIVNDLAPLDGVTETEWYRVAIREKLEREVNRANVIHRAIDREHAKASASPRKHAGVAE